MRYFWRRCLRIMPAFWCALLLTAFVLAPIAWVKEQGSISDYWNAPADSPFTYVCQNMFLVLDQRNIAGMGTSVPYADIGGYDWNGSAWTLQYEFKAYILVGVLGLVGYAASRWCPRPWPRSAIIVFNACCGPATSRLASLGTPLLAAPFGHPLPGRPVQPDADRAVRLRDAGRALGRSTIPVSDVLAVVAHRGRATSPTTTAAGTSAASTASSTS